MNKSWARMIAALFFVSAASFPAAAAGRIDFDGSILNSPGLGDALKPLSLARLQAVPLAGGRRAPAVSWGGRDAADWAVLVYMNAKNNLAPYGYKNFKQMEKVGSSSRVKIVVEFGLVAPNAVSQGGWRGTRRYLVEKSADPAVITSPALSESADTDMGDYHELISFVKWAKEKFPARHTMLVVWNHGSGWLESNSYVSVRGISYDDETGHHITTEQLGQALAAVGGVDVYASDACLMQMAEVDYQIKGGAQTIVGSEETEPGDGWTYDAFLSPLAANPSMGSEDVGRAAAQAYVSHYADGWSAVTQSAVRSSSVDGFAALLDSWTSRLMETNQRALARSARAQAVHFYYSDNIDVGDYVRLVAAGSPDEQTKAQSQKLLDFLGSGLVIDNRTQGASFQNARGLAVYLPAYRVDPAYMNLAWAKGGHWAQFAQWVADPNSYGDGADFPIADRRAKNKVSRL